MSNLLEPIHIKGFLTDYELCSFNLWCEYLLKEHIGQTHSSTKTYGQYDKKTKENSFIYVHDITETEESKALASVSGVSQKLDINFDACSHVLQRIVNKVKIPNMAKHTILQLLLFQHSHVIIPHFDPSIEGHITYKCNVYPFLPEDSVITVDKKDYLLNSGDLFCFAAGILGHSVPENQGHRYTLSYGFPIPYETFGLRPDDKRIITAKRILDRFFRSEA